MKVMDMMETQSPHSVTFREAACRARGRGPAMSFAGAAWSEPQVVVTDGGSSAAWLWRLALLGGRGSPWC